MHSAVPLRAPGSTLSLWQRKVPTRRLQSESVTYGWQIEPLLRAVDLQRPPHRPALLADESEPTLTQSQQARSQDDHIHLRERLLTTRALFTP